VPSEEDATEKKAVSWAKQHPRNLKKCTCRWNPSEGEDVHERENTLLTVKKKNYGSSPAARRTLEPGRIERKGSKEEFSQEGGRGDTGGRLSGKSPRLRYSLRGGGVLGGAGISSYNSSQGGLYIRKKKKIEKVAFITQGKRKQSKKTGGEALPVHRGA